jgi:hypothetical protein
VKTRANIRIGKDLFLDDTVSAYKQAKTNLSNNNPLSHSDLQALSNAIDNPGAIIHK